MKPENPTVSLNLKQINAEFDSFLTELRVKVPNLKAGKVLENPDLERERLEQEIKDKEIIADKIRKEMICWANKTAKKEGLEITQVAKALYLTLHPDKLSQDTSANAKYLKKSVLHEENKGFYFEKVRIKCQKIHTKRKEKAAFSQSSGSKKQTPFLTILKGKQAWIKKKKQGESLNFSPRLLHNYFADIAFAWLILKTYLLEILFTEALLVIAFLLISLPSMIIDYGFVLGVGLLFTDGPALVGIFLVLALPFLPGLLACAAERNAIEGYLFLIKTILLMPLVIIIAPVIFIGSLWSEKPDPKAEEKPKESPKAPDVKAPKAKKPYVKTPKPNASKSESEDALSESEASPRVSVRPGFCNGADDFD